MIKCVDKSSEPEFELGGNPANEKFLRKSGPGGHELKKGRRKPCIEGGD